MAEHHTAEELLPHIPDNLTIAQFMLDYQHDIRPIRSTQIPCLVDDITGHAIDFELLKSQTEDLANGLYMTFKIEEADTALILSPNHMNYPLTIWAMHRLGGIVSFSNPQFKADEVAYQLRTAKAAYIFVHSTFMNVAMEASRLVGIPSSRIIILDEPPHPHDISGFYNVPDLIVYGGQNMRAFQERRLALGEGKTKIAILCLSSGTTGKPKAVAIPHRALIANIIQMAVHNHVDRASCSREPWTYRPGDVSLGVLPFYHVAGLVICLHLALFCAMTVVVVPKYDFPILLESIFRHKISHLIIVPPIAIQFSKHPAAKKYRFEHVKYVLIGAAPLSIDIQEKLYDVFPTAIIGQAYGLTEMTATLAMVGGSQMRGSLGSSGKLLAGIHARVLKFDGSFARYGERGELIVKGPGMTLGYLHNDAATRENFVDGWVHTGDEVTMTPDQEIFVHDRLKDFLKVNGFQVAPSELEDCLLSHPDVAEACVIGIPDDYSGEVPLALIVLTMAAKENLNRCPTMRTYLTDSIIQHVEARKSPYKYLRGGVQIVKEIPKNGSGKILRRILRQEVMSKTAYVSCHHQRKGKL